MIALKDAYVGSIRLTSLVTIAHRRIELEHISMGSNLDRKCAFTMAWTFELRQGYKGDEGVAWSANRDGARSEIFSPIPGVAMKPAKRTMRVVVVTTVMLSFVSLWATSMSDTPH
jgi:hypothetical protein